MKKILIIILFILLSTNSFADKKFEKDLKKISKDSAFIDNSGKIYSVDKINKKENTILIIYTHGKDSFNSPNDYSMFKNLMKVKFVNITPSKCKKKATLGGYHGLALTECYFNQEAQNKDIITYLEKLYK